MKSRSWGLRLPARALIGSALLGAMTLAGQTLTLHGRIGDETGAGLPQARATLRSPASRWTTDAGDDGRYRFEGLPPGPYVLEVTKQGFAPRTLEVTLRESRELDVTLALAAVNTTLVVEDVAGKTTASRMSVPITDLPAQVSSVSRATLQEQGVNNMVDALRNVSGVSAMRWYGMYEYYTVRGFHIADVVLVDGMRLEGNRINTQLNNVEQVDVLKGPSSMLYGGQALSGAINVIRKKPQAIPAADLQYRAGRFGAHQAGGGVTGTVLGIDRLLYRVDASFDTTDDWRGAGARRVNLSPTLTWLVTGRHRVTVHQAVNRDRFDTDAGIPVGVLAIRGFNLATRFNTPQDFGLVKDSQTHVLYNANLTNGWELRNSFFYRYTNDQYYSAETLTFRPALNQVDRQFLYFKHHRRPVLNQADVVGQFRQWGMKHTFLAGYEYQDFYNFTHRSASRSVSIPPIPLATLLETYTPVSGFPISRVDYFTNRVNAFFWQDQIALASRLKLNVGGRLDGYRRIARNDPWANGLPASRGPELRRRQEAFTYRAGPVFSLTETQQLYASVSTSFQPVTQIPADGRELEPENGRGLEIGHRWQGWGGRLRSSLALYHLVRRNVLIARPNQEFDQAGRQSARGVDFDLEGDLGRGLRVVANYGYTLPRFDRFFISNGAVDLSGFRPRFTQRHAANAWVTRNWRAGAFASAGMRYLSSMFTNNSNTVRLGGFTVFSGAAGLRRSAWEWSINAENLLGRSRYFIAGIYDNQIYPGGPVNVFTTIRYRF